MRVASKMSKTTRTGRSISPIHSFRAAGRTITFFLKVLPMLPSKPVDWVTRDPVIERVTYPAPGGSAAANLFLPGTSGRHPGVLVCLGAVPDGVDHPQVARLGAALARAGFATLLYWSPAMRDLRLDPVDIKGIAMAYRWLIDRPDIDGCRSGLLGTCVGGSFALMAATDTSIRDQVAFVVAWAPYASIRTLACDIASGATVVEGKRVPWEVDQLTRMVYIRSLTQELDPEERDRLRNADPSVDSDLSLDGRTVASLLTARNVEDARTAINGLSEQLKLRLDAMSPVNQIESIRAPLILIAHDRNDPVIPIGESQSLVALLNDRTGLRYTEFRMFKHLDPSKVNLPKRALIRELVRFCSAVYPLFRQSV